MRKTLFSFSLIVAIASETVIPIYIVTRHTVVVFVLHPAWYVSARPCAIGMSHGRVRCTAAGPKACYLVTVLDGLGARNHNGRGEIFPFYYLGFTLTTEIGIVKWFNNDKGFGFIMPESGGKDLFAHYSDIQGGGHKTLEENQRVSFVATQGQKGPQATMIQVI